MNRILAFLILLLLLSATVYSQRVGQAPERPVDRTQEVVVTGVAEEDYARYMHEVLYPADGRFMMAMPWPVFRRYLEDGLEAKLLFSEAFCKAHNIPDAIRERVEAEVTYATYMSFTQAPVFHQSKVRDLLAEFPYQAEWEEVMQRSYSRIDWNDPALLDVPQFVSFAVYYLDQEIPAHLQGESFLMDAYRVINKTAQHPAVREFFLMRYAQRFLGGELPANRELAASFFREHVRNPEYLKRFDELLERAPQFGTGLPAFDFTLEDIEGRQVSLSSFRGQPVYLDFWTTGCPPCIREKPHLKKLKGDLEGQVAVLTVSLDAERNRDRWEEMTSGFGLGDYQLYAGELADELRKHYEVRGIPHYVIIDKDGTIFWNKSVRPSNPQTRIILESLIK